MSRWGTALWGQDRWPALAVADLLQVAPDPARGVPIGLGDWKLSVEILLPSAAESLWGIGTWGDAEWNVLAWQDLTPWVRGAEWTRGSDEPYGRARIGELSVTLDCNEDRFSPWNPSPPGNAVAYFGPGTVIRVGARSATDTRAGGWLPQITCVVDQWGMVYADPTCADRFVDVTAVETLRDLSQLDDNALPGVVGGGEGAGARLYRLLVAAGWQYGFLIEAQNVLAAPGTNYPVQSTDMAGNRLAECYLTADACDATFRTDRTGAAILTNVEYISVIGPADPRLIPLVEFSNANSFDYPWIGLDWLDRESATVPGLFVAAYDPDSFTSAPDDHNVINDARFARVGGSQQTYEQVASISRHGRRTLVRNDFISTSDPVIALIAQYTTVRRALNVLRVTSLTVSTSDRPEQQGLSVLAADVGNAAYVFPPDGVPGIGARPYVRGFISNMTHRVTPRNGAEVTWQTTFGFDTRTVYNIPGAQLPATT